MLPQMKKLSILLILISLLISCQEKSQLTLPDTEYYNMEILPTTHLINRVDLIQINDDSVQVAYGDTQIFAIDSNLHFHVFKSTKIELPKEYFNSFYTTISFDRETSYRSILIIKNELRKLGLYNIVLLTTENKAISFRLAPLSQKEMNNRHPFNIKSHLLPPGAPPKIKNDTVKNTLEITHNNGGIHVSDNKGRSVSLQEELEKKEKLIIILKMSDKNNYQDYLNILGTVLKTYRNARAKLIIEKGYSEREAKKKYPIRIK